MGSAFNPQILVDKLVKLNSSQASIETLSHWCIFHMNKAKRVVETWDRQFHLSPHEQRLAFLYLANDILQNSRRKGSEFVVEFWKVLPDALRDVIENGDESGRNAALRLIGIWEERKVFGLRAQSLKEEFLGEQLEKINRDGKHLGLKLPVGRMLDKIVSSFQVVYGAEKDEDVILSKCRSAMAYVDKVDKEIGLDTHPGQFHGAAFMEELQGQHAILRDSIEQLTAIESSRTHLISRLREAILEQESKLEQVCHQLQAACSQSEQAGSLCQRLLHSHDGQLVGNQSLMEASKAIAAQSVVTGEGQKSDPATCKQQVSSPEKNGHIAEDPPQKSAAAAMAEKLTTSTSSAQMLSYVLSSLASEGIIGNSRKEPSSEYPSEKRAKLENHQPYIPTESHPQDPHPSFQHPESFPSNVTSTTLQSTANDPPPPPSSPPPLPPLPPVPQYLVPQYVPVSGSINGLPIYGVPYGFNMSQQLPPSLPSYPAMGTATTVVTPTMRPMNSYQTYQGSEGNMYSLPSSTQVAMWNTSRFV